MDTCCYNRRIPKNYLDRNAVMIIFELVEMGLVSLCGSFILMKEIGDTADEFKRKMLNLMYSLCVEEIQVNDCIIDRAIEVSMSTSIREKDGIHLACAEFANVDVF